VRDFYPFQLGARFEEQFTAFYHAFSPDGSRIAISGCWGSVTNTARCERASSGLLFVADPFSGALVADIPLDRFWPGGVDFTADGSALLYATNEHRVALWDLQTNAPGLTLYQKANSRTNSYPYVAAAPDGSGFAAIVSDTLHVWNSDGSLRFQAPTRPVALLAYAAEAPRLLAPAPDAGALNVYDTLSGALLRTLPVPFSDAHLSPDGRSLAVADWGSGTIQAFDVDSGEQLGGFSLSHRAESVRFNPAGDLLVISGLGDLQSRDSYFYVATLADTRTWQPLGEMYSVASAGSVRFSRDGRSMAIFARGAASIYGPPDAALQAALESVRRFQAALHAGDYAAAAALLQPDEINREDLESQGVDLNDLPAALARLCASQELACQPLLEPVMLGYDYGASFVLARLQAPEGGALVTPRGGTLISFYLSPGEPPVLITLPLD
jgi:WD40 repeat protein